MLITFHSAWFGIYHAHLLNNMYFLHYVLLSYLTRDYVYI